MNARYLTQSVAALLAFQCRSLTAAGPVVLHSPKIVHTYADNSVLWQQLQWRSASQELVATLTFSNVDYVSDGEPQHDETFSFPLTGVKYDAGTGTFSVSRSHDRSLPVAVWRQRLFVNRIELLPGVQLKAANHGGRVTVQLVVRQ